MFLGGKQGGQLLNATTCDNATAWEPVGVLANNEALTRDIGADDLGHARSVKALVTGANGFLGRHVVGALISRGVGVRAVVRPASRLEGLGWPSSVEVFRADLRTSCELPRAFADVDVLLHLAAVVSGGEDAQFAGTVVGTERLLDAMAATACRRLILCSSFSVYDYSSIYRILDEDSPLHQTPDVYTRDGYTVSKWWQERVARRFAEKHGWDITVLRPGFIWGRDHGYLAALGQQFGRHHLVIGPLTRIPMTHVENCADVFALTAANERAKGQTLNVVDGPGERIWAYLSDYIHGSGQPGWRLPMPYWLAIGTVRLAFATVFRTATKVPSILIPRRFESRLRPLRFENRKLRETLGWIPPLNYQQCLARTYGEAMPFHSPFERT
jgi:UDP-glucose 4-epimerase